MSLAVRWDVWWPVGAAVALVGESGCGRATPTRPEQPVSSGRSVNLGRHDIGSGCRRARSWAGGARGDGGGRRATSSSGTSSASTAFWPRCRRSGSSPRRAAAGADRGGLPDDGCDDADRRTADVRHRGRPRAVAADLPESESGPCCRRGVRWCGGGADGVRASGAAGAGAWQSFTMALGLLSGAGVAALTATLLRASQLASWGWRLPFLPALPLGPVALWLRAGLTRRMCGVRRGRCPGPARAARAAAAGSAARGAVLRAGAAEDDRQGGVPRRISARGRAVRRVSARRTRRPRSPC